MSTPNPLTSPDPGLPSFQNTNIIHQIFLDIGKGPLSNFPLWIENTKVTRRLNPGYSYQLWDDRLTNLFIDTYYPQYKNLINDFPHKFYLIDFVRYLILDHYGGIYMDLDVRSKRPLPEKATTILGSSYYKPEKVNNNVIMVPASYTQKLIHYAESEYNRIKSKNLYKNWPVRRFMHTVSAGMFERFCRKNSLTSETDFREYFYDEEARSWIDKNNGITKVNYHHREVLGLPPSTSSI